MANSLHLCCSVRIVTGHQASIVKLDINYLYIIPRSIYTRSLVFLKIPELFWKIVGIMSMISHLFHNLPQEFGLSGVATLLYNIFFHLHTHDLKTTFTSISEKNYFCLLVCDRLQIFFDCGMHTPPFNTRT